jgi:uncharacterized protein with von Willebrand factor type A (vWA) domain
MKKDMAALGAAAQALKNATKEVDDLRDAQRAMGVGPGDVQQIPAEEFKKRFEQIKKSQTLRRIMELAGRYRRLAQTKQRQKTRHGQDDIVGVELGNDLGRLCPSELAALADEDLELNVMRRYLERGLMQRDYRGIETKARGPIVVVVDESRSMSGERIATAKAFALAMAWIARHQKRYICLVGFASGSDKTCLVMPPNQFDQAGLIGWLEHFFNGGTTCDVPLRLLPKNWEKLGVPTGETDMIIITDGCMDVSSATVKKYNDWKHATQVKCYTMIIGEDEPGDLEHVSDRAWCLPDLSIENDAIQELMAI